MSATSDSSSTVNLNYEEVKIDANVKAGELSLFSNSHRDNYQMSFIVLDRMLIVS